MKKTVSVKNTIGIREYMNYYLEVPYLNDEGLSRRKRVSCSAFYCVF